MRPGLLRHRKFARLARLLGSEPLALGHLEMLWAVAYENGDELLGDAGDVEYLARWGGDPGRLAAALTESGFLEEHPDGYHVHDLWDHAPDYVRKRRSRECERQEKGAKLESASGQCLGSDRTLTGHCPPNVSQCPPNGRTRAPAPAPTPTQEAAARVKPEEPELLKPKEPDSPQPLPSRAEAECNRWPLLTALAEALGPPGGPMQLPVAEKSTAMESTLLRFGVDAVAAQCKALVEARKESGHLKRLPRHIAYFAPLLEEMRDAGTVDLRPGTGPPPRGKTPRVVNMGAAGCLQPGAGDF